MIPKQLVTIRVGFALFADAISRLFNLLRIALCTILAFAVLLNAGHQDHNHTNKWMIDLVVLGVLFTRLGRWVSIVRRGGGL